MLWSDSTRLIQALLNLLSNAVKYNRKNDRVTLSCQQIPDQMLRIRVADTGMAIPKNLIRDTDTIVFGKMSFGGHERKFAHMELIIKFSQCPKLTVLRSP